MIGVISLFLGCLCSIIACMAYIIKALRQQNSATKSSDFSWGAFCYQLTVIFSLTASGALLYALLQNQFQYTYVWSYSSLAAPLAYKIAAFWAGQEGSFLLWLLLHCLIGGWLLKKSALSDAGFAAYTAIQVFLQILLLVKNPFMLQPSPGPDGMGLNPLLQDFWMVIHPPIVFIGYALFAVPFAFAISALWQKQQDRWLEKALPWAAAAWAFLGAGIFIGAYWAYKTLGWGGYWGWDPVENASLIPWLTGTALLHVLQLARKKKAAQGFAHIAAIYTFLLVLYGTYLTRSGVLSDFSVHSFGKDSSAGILSLLIFLLTLAATLLLCVRWSELPGGEIFQTFCSREFFLTGGTMALMGLAALVLIGTSTPLLTQFMRQPQSISSSFYNHCTLPLGTVLLLAALFACWQSWQDSVLRNSRALLAGGLFSLVSALGAAWIYQITNPPAVLALAAAIALLLQSLLQLTKGFSPALSIGHAGFALLAAGILLSSLGAQKENIQLSAGEKALVFNQEILYQGSEKSTAQTKEDLFLLPQTGRQSNALTKYTADGREAAHEPAIFHSLTQDLYIAPGQQNKPERQMLRLAKDQTAELSGTSFLLKSVTMDKTAGDALSFTVLLAVKTAQSQQNVLLTMVHDSGHFTSSPVTIDDHLQLSIQALNPDKQEASIVIADMGESGSGQLVLEISTKPWISLVWAGCILITAGCFLSVKTSKMADKAYKKML